MSVFKHNNIYRIKNDCLKQNLVDIFEVPRIWSKQDDCGVIVEEVIVIFLFV